MRWKFNFKKKRKKRIIFKLIDCIFFYLSSNLFRGDLVVNDLQVQRLDGTVLLSLLMLTSQLMSNNLHFKNGGGLRRRNGDYNQLRLVTKEARGARACCVVLHVCGRAGECFIHASIPPHPNHPVLCNQHLLWQGNILLFSEWPTSDNECHTEPRGKGWFYSSTAAFALTASYSPRYHSRHRLWRNADERRGGGRGGGFPESAAED